MARIAPSSRLEITANLGLPNRALFTQASIADSFALVSMFNAANLTGGRGVTARWSALVGDGTDKDENIHVGRPASSFGISVPLRGLCFGRNQRFLYQPPK
jgi:hypothetical protein